MKKTTYTITFKSGRTVSRTFTPGQLYSYCESVTNDILNIVNENGEIISLNRDYVIMECGSRWALKEKVNNFMFSASLFVSCDLEKVKSFAESKKLNVIAIGDIYAL